MRRNILACLLIFFSLSVFAQRATKDLVGKWEGADSQSMGASIQFLDTSKVILIMKGKVMPSTTYTTDLPKNPARLDINMLKPNGKTATLQGFLLFVDDNTIRWQIFPPYTDRPATYNENSSDVIITLKRIK